MDISLGQIITYLLPIGIWILTVAITLRLIMKKQAVSATLSWLMVVYLIPIVGIVAYLILGEINLGKRRAEAFKKLQPKYFKWFGQIAECHNLVNTDNALLYRPIFDLTQKRLGIPCVLGNELHILDTPEKIMQSIIADIREAQNSINCQ